jgi:hypothetical protein
LAACEAATALDVTNFVRALRCSKLWHFAHSPIQGGLPGGGQCRAINSGNWAIGFKIAPGDE